MCLEALFKEARLLSTNDSESEARMMFRRASLAGESLDSDHMSGQTCSSMLIDRPREHDMRLMVQSSNSLDC